MARDTGRGLKAPSSGADAPGFHPRFAFDSLISRHAGPAGFPAETEARLRVGKIIHMAGASPGSGVLLVGEGEGMLAERLRRAGAEVTWLEPAGGGAMLDVASPLPSEGYTRLVGNLFRLPFGDENFDLVASQLTLEYQKDLADLLQEWMRVTRKGGSLVLVTLNALFRGRQQRPHPRPVRSFTPEELRGLVKPLGVESIETCTLMPDLILPGFYRRDLSFFLRLAQLPYFERRGKLLFLKGTKGGR